MAGETVNWKATEEEILLRIDIVAELISDVRFSRTQPNESGFVECYAIDRDESNPSCHIYVGTEHPRRRGSYGDQAKTQKPLSFWELLVALGRFPDWRAARAYYAEKTGVKLPDPTKRQKDGRGRPASVRLIDHRFSRHLMDLAGKFRPGITAAAIEAAGYVAAQYVPTETEAYAFPVYHSPTEEPRTYVMLSALAKVFPRSGQHVPERGHHIWGNDDGFAIVGNPADGSARGIEALKQATTVVWCEGISDMLAAYQHLPAGWVAVTSPKGAAKGTSAAMAELLQGKQVIVIGDSDTAGVSGAKIRAGQAVSAGAAAAHMRRPPGEVTSSRGRDLRDHFVAGLTWGDLIDIDGSIPLIEINVDAPREEVVAAAVEALAKYPGIYQQNGTLVRLVEYDKQGGKSYVEPLPSISASVHITAVARLVKVNKKGELIPAQPPEWLGPAIVRHTDVSAHRELLGIVMAPFIRDDGTICRDPGYDPHSKVFLSTNLDWKKNAGILDDFPGEIAISEAKNRLLELFGDFPFATERDRSAIIAALLTVFAKPAFGSGVTPLFMIDGNSPGVGKGLLIDIIGQIAIGRPVPATIYTPDETEMRKHVVSMALSYTLPIIKLDEVAGNIGGHVLNSVMTSGTISGRELGKSRTHDMRLDAVWLATGNNVTVRGDFARRVIWIRLESPFERPSSRDGFRFPNILRHVAERRERYVNDVLTILRAYFVAECPRQPLKGFGSYEAWSDIVRQCVIWLGLPDPHAPEVVAEVSDDHNEERQLIHGLDEVLCGDWGTVSDIVRRVQSSSASEYPAMRDLIFSKWGEGKDTLVKLGKFLKKHSEKNIDGMKIVSRRNRSNVTEWRVTRHELGSSRWRGEPMQEVLEVPEVPYITSGKEKLNYDNLDEDENKKTSKENGRGLPPTPPAPPAVGQPRQENPRPAPLWTRPPEPSTEIAFTQEIGETPRRCRWSELPAGAVGYAMWPFSNGWQSVEHVRKALAAGGSSSGNSGGEVQP